MALTKVTGTVVDSLALSKKLLTETDAGSADTLREYIDGEISSVSTAVATQVSAAVDAAISGAFTSFKKFGAVGDGITDDTIPLQLALDSGLHVLGGAGTYRITSGLTLPTGTRLDMDPNCVIDMVDAPNGTVAFTAAGSEGSAMLLTANAAAAAVTVSVASTIGLAVGDIVRILSNRTVTNVTGGTKCAELNTILSLTSTSVTFTLPIRYPYNTADAAQITKITPVKNIRVTGGKIIGANGAVGGDTFHTGFGLSRVDNVAILGVHLEGTAGVGLIISDAIGCSIAACRFERFTSVPATTNLFANIGIMALGCVQDLYVQDNFFKDTSTAFLAGGSVSPGGLPTNVNVTTNDIRNCRPMYSSANPAISFADAEVVSVSNNIIQYCTGNGINCSARRAVIADNDMTNVVTGVYYKSVARDASEVVVRGNNIRAATADGVTIEHGGGVTNSNGQFNRVAVTDNYVLTAAGRGIAVFINGTIANPGNIINNVTINNNTVTNATDTSMFIKGATIGTIANNVITGVAVNKNGILFDRASDFTVTGNHVLAPASSTAACIRIGNSGTFGATHTITVLNNRMGATNYGSTATLYGVYIDANTVWCTIGENHYDGVGTAISATGAQATGHSIDFPTYFIFGYTIPSIAADTSNRQTITVPGVRLGDFIRLSYSVDANDVLLFGQASADDTVKVNAHNRSGGTRAASTGDLRVWVQRHRSRD